MNVGELKEKLSEFDEGDLVTLVYEDDETEYGLDAVSHDGVEHVILQGTGEV